MSDETTPRNGAPDNRETVTDHDAAPATRAAELARSPGQSPRGTGDTTREPVDGPATWQDECADVEAAFTRSGVRPTWPDDEPGNIGPMAAAMAAEIARLRLTDAERETLERQALWLSAQAMNRKEIQSCNLLMQEASTLRALLARHGGDA